jgi:Putative prokaryotic signal transducing protein
MAQDPEEQPDDDLVDTSHDLDMITLFSSSNVDAELEATAIHSMLQASGIPSVVVGASTLPVLEFQVQVPRELAAEAERVLEEARAAGPEAAAEAERATEETQ